MDIITAVIVSAILSGSVKTSFTDSTVQRVSSLAWMLFDECQLFKQIHLLTIFQSPSKYVWPFFVACCVFCVLVLVGSVTLQLFLGHLLQVVPPPGHG